MSGQLVPTDPFGSSHAPVLLAEVVNGLNIRPGMRIIDGTLGGGGHTAAMMEQSAPDGCILGLDADPAAIRRVSDRLAPYLVAGRLVIAQDNFVNIEKVAAASGFTRVDAILLDLGLSSFQLATSARGFSFAESGPLDMRFDPAQSLTAAEIVNEWPEEELAAVLYRYADEHRSRRIAQKLVQARPITSTDELAVMVSKAVGGRRGKRTHPATKTFQALRIAVNHELDYLESAMPQCLSLLKPKGRLAIISFHSLEDRIVKQWMQTQARDFIHDKTHPFGGYERVPTIRLINRKPISASAAEVERNPRSRSAKLRIGERI